MDNTESEFDRCLELVYGIHEHMPSIDYSPRYAEFRRAEKELRCLSPPESFRLARKSSGSPRVGAAQLGRIRELWGEDETLHDEPPHMRTLRYFHDNINVALRLETADEKNAILRELAAVLPEICNSPSLQ